MRNISLKQFYSLGKILGMVQDLKPVIHETAWMERIDLPQSAVHVLAEVPDVGYCIRPDFSLDAARKLLEALKAVAASCKQTGKRTLRLDESAVAEARRAARTFEELFLMELDRIQVYAIANVGIYSGIGLVERGDEVLPEDIRAAVPEMCARELRAAGRCIAMELATAAAFHIMRAVESVMLHYWKAVTSEPVPENRNWGLLIRRLRDNGGDAKVLAALDQFRELHRNPIMHPEAELTLNEALTLWQVAPGAIIAMVTDSARRGFKLTEDA